MENEDGCYCLMVFCCNRYKDFELDLTKSKNSLFPFASQEKFKKYALDQKEGTKIKSIKLSLWISIQSGEGGE